MTGCPDDAEILSDRVPNNKTFILNTTAQIGQPVYINCCPMSQYIGPSVFFSMCCIYVA